MHEPYSHNVVQAYLLLTQLATKVKSARCSAAVRREFTSFKPNVRSAWEGETEISKTGGHALKGFNNSGSSKSNFDYENMVKYPSDTGLVTQASGVDAGRMRSVIKTRFH